MQPFSITCETCQARLKVRNESAIGQILSCPQCQSMVQVSAPEGWSSQPAEAAAIETSHSDVPIPTKTTAPPVAESPEALSDSPVESIPVSVPSVPPPAPAVGLDPLDPNWASPTEQAWRKLILRSAAGGVGLLVIGALVGYILTLRSDPSPVVPVPLAEVPDSVLDNEPEKEPEKEASRDPAPVPPENASEEKIPSAASVDPTAEEKDSTPQSKPAEKNPAKPAEEPKDTNGPENLPPEIPVDGLKPAADPNNESPVAPDSWVSRRVPPKEEPAHTHDVASQLSEKIIRINFRDVSLVHLLQFLSDMTALPITLDMPGLASTDVTPQTRVSIQKEDTTVVEVLTTVLSEQGLTYLTRGDQLLVTSPSASTSKPRTLRYPIDDLVGDTDTKTFADLLQQMVAPSSWQTAGGVGSIQIEEEKLAIEQTMLVHQQLVTFCERLRVARGLPTRSRYSTDRFRLATRHSRASALLAKLVSFTFHEPTRLSDVVRHLETNTGTTVLISWRSLSREKFTFATQIECSVKEQTLDRALTAMLTPIGLAWRPVDAQTVEILGRSDAEKNPIREFYPLAPLLAAGLQSDEILDQIRQGTSAELWTAQKGLGTLYYDALSKHLVVRHTYAVQVQVQGLLKLLTDQLREQ